jgi:phosphoglycolate phosphatase
MQFTHPVRVIYEKQGLTLSDEEFAELADRFHELYTAHSPSCSLHEDALEHLEIFHQRGVEQSILSALPKSLLDILVEHHGLKKYFTKITGQSNTLGSGKLDLGVDHFNTLNLKQESTLLIGDTSHDHEVATHLGIKCFLISRGYETEVRLRERTEQTYGSIRAVANKIIL